MKRSNFFIAKLPLKSSVDVKGDEWKAYTTKLKTLRKKSQS